IRKAGRRLAVERTQEATLSTFKTRSLPDSARCYPRNFTFYLGNPSARLTTIARAVRVNRPYLVWCRRNLQSLAVIVYPRKRYDSPLWGTGSIGDWFHHPLPADMAVSVDSPSCPTAFIDLHSPVIAVGRNCEHICEGGR